MKTRTQRIDRVTAELEPHDKSYQIYNPFHPRFYVTPAKVIAEFERDEPDWYKSVLRATIIGQRYRVLANGVKAVGPGRGNPEEPTTWGFPSVNSMPQALIDLLYEVTRWQYS